MQMPKLRFTDADDIIINQLFKQQRQKPVSVIAVDNPFTFVSRRYSTPNVFKQQENLYTL